MATKKKQAVEIRTGSKLTEQERNELQKLQALFDPEQSLKRLDDFTKWMFTIAATVGTLGAGFANSAFSTPTTWGQASLAAAILFVGLSLAIALNAIAPKARPIQYNPNSPESMRKAYNTPLRARSMALQWSAAMFGLGLLSAATSPLLSTIERSSSQDGNVDILYQYTADKKLSVELMVRDLKPKTTVDFALKSEPLESNQLLPRIRAIADEKGKATGKLELPEADIVGARLWGIVQWQDPRSERTVTIEKPINIPMLSK